MRQLIYMYNIQLTYYVNCATPFGVAVTGKPALIIDLH